MDTHNHIRTRLNEAQNILNEIAGMIDPPAEIYTPDQIVEVICTEFDITSDQLNSKSNKGTLSMARVMYCLMLYNHVTDNKSEITRIMGRSAHSRIISFLSTADSLQSNKIFKGKLQAVKERLYSSHFNVK